LKQSRRSSSLRGAKRRSNPQRRKRIDGLLRFARNDVETYVLIPAAHFARVLQSRCRPLQTEGAGKAGCRLTPAVSCAKRTVIDAHEHTGSAETARPSPRNGFTTYFVLSPVSGLVCHRHCAGYSPRNLTPASRRQDHTTSPYAFAHSSALARLKQKRPSHSDPTHRDDRETPLGWARMGEVIIPIFRIVKRNIFDSGA